MEINTGVFEDLAAKVAELEETTARLEHGLRGVVRAALLLHGAGTTEAMEAAERRLSQDRHGMRLVKGGGA